MLAPFTMLPLSWNEERSLALKPEKVSAGAEFVNPAPANALGATTAKALPPVESKSVDGERGSGVAGEQAHGHLQKGKAGDVLRSVEK